MYVPWLFSPWWLACFLNNLQQWDGTSRYAHSMGYCQKTNQWAESWRGNLKWILTMHTVCDDRLNIEVQLPRLFVRAKINTQDGIFLKSFPKLISPSILSKSITNYFLHCVFIFCSSNVGHYQLENWLFARTKINIRDGIFQKDFINSSYRVLNYYLLHFLFRSLNVDHYQLHITSMIESYNQNPILILQS